MKKLFKIFFALILCLLNSSCIRESEFIEKSFFLMGTIVTVTLPSSSEKEFKEVLNIIKKYSEIIISDTKMISQSTEGYVNDFTCRIIKNSYKYYDLSGGRFNPAIDTLLYLYGFPEGPFVAPNENSLNNALKIAKGKILITENEKGCYINAQGKKIGLGALAKGAIIDKAADYLKGQGINNFIINGGGDLYASGKKRKKSWRIGINDPEKIKSYIKIVLISDKALATSGNYERFFIDNKGRTISHLMDGNTGEQSNKYKSVSVIAERAEDADALATAFFFIDKKEIYDVCSKINTPVMTITAQGKVETICGFEKYILK